MRKVKLLICLCYFSLVYNVLQAQIPSYILTVKNFETPKFGGKSITFDIHILHTDNNIFEYAGGQYFFEFHSAVANGGILSYEMIDSYLPPNMRTINPTIIDNKDGTSRLGLSMNPLPGPRNGFIIPEGLPGVMIARMRLTTTANTLLVRYDPLDFHAIDLRLKYIESPSDSSTKLLSYIGRFGIDITNPSNHFIDSSGLRVYPVELMSFTSDVYKNNVTLRWTTATELNNSGFEIQRKNAITEDWKNMGFVRGFGTTNENTEYTFIDNVNSGKYNYRLKQIDYNGNYEFFNLANEVIIEFPSKYYLSQNYPNPFNPITHLEFGISKLGFVSLKVYDILGNEVKTLVNENKTAGSYSVEFEGADLPSGIYFYTLKTNSFTDTKRMLLIK